MMKETPVRHSFQIDFKDGSVFEYKGYSVDKITDLDR